MHNLGYPYLKLSKISYRFKMCANFFIESGFNHFYQTKPGHSDALIDLGFAVTIEFFFLALDARQGWEILFCMA